MGYPFKQYGSLERYMVCLSRECKKKGYRIFIHFDSDLMPYDEHYVKDIYDAGGEIVGFAMNGKYDIKYLLKMMNLIKEKCINVVHSYFSPTCHIASWAAQLCGVKGKFRTIGSMPYTHEYKFRPFNAIRQNLLAFPLKKIVTVCDAIKREYSSYFRVNEKKVMVIYGGTDIEKYNPNSDFRILEIKKEFGINENEKLIGIIADLEPRKGHKFLLEAMLLIIEEVPNVNLLLVGDGTLKNQLQNTCEKLGISNRVVFTGIRNDVENIIPVLDVSVLPSLWGEGLSAAILESMAAGKPVVATDIGGSSELIQHGRSGFIVPARDSNALAQAILRLLKDRKLATKMGFEGRKIVKQKFDSQMRADKELELYENFIIRNI